MSIQEPFYLGMEGEYWNEKISALIVPVPDTELNYFVARTRKKQFVILGFQQQTECSCLLEAALMVADKLNRYPKGNRKD